MGAKPLHRRLRREQRTITAMVRIYCRGHKHPVPEGATLCPDCEGLLAYAHRRLEHCRYQEHKPTCGKCPVHCYSPGMKERVIAVMMYSGPRMTYRHPVYALWHLLDGLRPVPSRKPTSSTPPGS